MTDSSAAPDAQASNDAIAVTEKLRDLGSLINRSTVVVRLWQAIEGWPVKYVSDNIGRFGYSPEDLTSGRIAWRAIIHPEDMPYIEAQVGTWLRSGQAEFTQEYRLFTKSGEARWIEERSTVHKSSDHTVAEVQGIIQDVTDRRRVQAELERSENLLTESQRIAHVGSWEWDLKTMVLFWSQETYRVFGVTPETFTPTIEGFVAFVHPDDREFVKKSIGEAIHRHAPYDLDHRIIRADGTQRVIHEQGQVFYDANGTPVRTLGTAWDITERKQAESVALLYQKRLRRMAYELSGAEQRERRRLSRVLHDHLQQLLVAAKIKTASMAEGVPEDELRQEAKKITAILAEAIAESRSLAVELCPPILQDGSLPKALKWLARWMHQNHALTVDLESDETVVSSEDEAVRAELFQAVRELLFNVIKHAQVNTASVSLKRSSGEVRIVVSDGGAGFDSALLASDRGPSDRLGLFGLRERLEVMGGRVEVDSAPGRGTRVTLVVPVISPAEEDPLRVASAPAPVAATNPGPLGHTRQRGSIRVLLVDDHPIVRQGLAQLLNREPGIEVVGEAPDGLTAERLAQEIHPDIVIMDLNMPGRNGIQSTRTIRSLLPGVQVIGLSTYEEVDQAEAMRQAGAAAYVAKSESPGVLIAAIRACCRKPDSSAL